MNGCDSQPRWTPQPQFLCRKVTGVTQAGTIQGQNLLYKSGCGGLGKNMDKALDPISSTTNNENCCVVQGLRNSLSLGGWNSSRRKA